MTSDQSPESETQRAMRLRAQDVMRAIDAIRTPDSQVGAVIDALAYYGDAVATHTRTAPDTQSGGHPPVEGEWWPDSYCQQHAGFHLQNADGGTGIVFHDYADAERACEALNVQAVALREATAEVERLRERLEQFEGAAIEVDLALGPWLHGERVTPATLSDAMAHLVGYVENDDTPAPPAQEEGRA